MKGNPQLPSALLDRLEPVRRELRAIIAAIRADEWNLSLWKKADELICREREIEAAFFDRKDTAP